MACVNVSGELCFDMPGPDTEEILVWAPPIINNTYPDSYPYVAPTPVWGTNPGGGVSLPTLNGGWAIKGTWDGSNPFDSNWKFKTLEFSTSGWYYQVTLGYTTEADQVFTLPHTTAKFVVNLKDDVLESITVDQLTPGTGSPSWSLY